MRFPAPLKSSDVVQHMTPETLEPKLNKPIFDAECEADWLRYKQERKEANARKDRRDTIAFLMLPIWLLSLALPGDGCVYVFFGTIAVMIIVSAYDMWKGDKLGDL